MKGFLLYRHQNWLKKKYLRSNLQHLRVRDFSIVANNCWGGIVCDDVGVQYRSPFVNMFMYADCYLKMLEDLNHYLSSELKFANTSSYFDQLPAYPVGLLRDAEIHFIHYKTNEEAADGWQRRKMRINPDRLMVVLSERDGCSESHIKRFDALPYREKLFFATRPYDLKTTKVVASNFWNRTVPPADQMAGLSYVKLDLVSYLNNLYEQY